jgi:hypothetical protein
MVTVGLAQRTTLILLSLAWLYFADMLAIKIDEHVFLRRDFGAFGPVHVFAIPLLLVGVGAISRALSALTFSLLAQGWSPSRVATFYIYFMLVVFFVPLLAGIVYLLINY